MPKGMPGNKSTHVNPEEAKALAEYCDKEAKKQGKEVSEHSVLKAALRAYLKLDK